MYEDEYHPRNINAEIYYEEVAQRVMVPDSPSYFIETICLARTGSTASLNFMNSSDFLGPDGSRCRIQAAYQHLKAGFRQAMHGWPNKEWNFEIPRAESFSVFYGKDPLGPYTDIESRFNPMKVLEMTPFPRDNIFLTFLLREPSEILASWKRNWGAVRDGDVLRRNLITSFHSLQSIYEESHRNGYHSAVRVYEDLKYNDPKAVVGTLFDRINEHLIPKTGGKLVQTNRTVRDWDLSTVGSIWQPDEPSIYQRPEIKNLHRDAKGGKTGLVYKSYSPEERESLLSDDDLKCLESSGVYDIYNFFADIERSYGLCITS